MIKFSLYENAIDSIDHGIEHLKRAVEKDSKRDYKQAILLISHGTEVLLKELLCQINPIYVFDKNSLFDKCNDYMNPKLDELYNCKSIEINKLCSEVLRLYSTQFDKNSIRIFEKLTRERNKLQHFCVEIDKSEIQSLILGLYNMVIKRALSILSSKVIDGQTSTVVEEKLDDIFCFVKAADQEEAILKLEQKDFTRGSCFNCGNYSLFIFYDNDSYPNKVYCTSCGFNHEDISEEDYRICPECGVNSLVYDHSLQGGICLWYRCANIRDGGILTEMEFCMNCHDFKIEKVCNCNKTDN